MPTILKEMYVDNRVTDLGQYQDFLDAKRKKEEEDRKKKLRDREKAKKAVDGAEYEFGQAISSTPVIGSN